MIQKQERVLCSSVCPERVAQFTRYGKKAREKEIRNIRLLSRFQPRLPLDNEKAMTDHPALFCSLEWH